ncbi:MAG: hypothetical protein Q4D20_04130 [Clostridia bacterium]|nr:hypothetical protein [Clostridia bacterium]
MTKKITALVLVLAVVVCCFSACALTPDKKILGSWKDSTGVVGLEFKEGGVCKISGNAAAISSALSAFSVDSEGTYTIVKDEATKEYHLTLNFNFVISVKLEYVITDISKDVLTFTSVDSGKVYSFVADNGTTTSSAPASDSSASDSSAAA